MAAQRLNGIVAARDVGFAQMGMDGLVTDVMQQNSGAFGAAAQTWHKVVPALRNVRWNRAVAKRADRSGGVVGHGDDCAMKAVAFKPATGGWEHA